MDTHEEHDDYTRVERALAFIYDNFQTQPSLEEVAEHVHLSPFHFQRLFQRWAGVSPKKFLQYLTLQAAKERLRDNADLLSVAHELGLSGPSRLHDLFVSVEGITPGTYKDGGSGLAIYHASFTSPFGPCTLAATERGLCALSFFEQTQVLANLRQEWPGAVLLEDRVQLEPYYAAVFQKGEGRRDLRLLLKGSSFRLKVWEALLQIPEGRVVSYSQLATMVEQPKAVRAVASAVASNPIALFIPCHRVIRGLGQMGGYRWGIPRKLAMLGWEASRQAVSSV